MKKLYIYLLLAGFAFASCSGSDENVSGLTRAQEKKIDSLMRVMTLEEKIGQLNLPVTGDIVTGQASSSDVSKRIRAGEVGGLFNLKGVDAIREVQRLAVEESRLGIPLLFGMDVIHGYETVFPIPLGLSCSWDMEAVEQSARIAAVEASADGISWTFSPMLDISRDPRWGRVSEGNGEDPYLAAAIARAMVKGYQGDDMSADDEIMSCVKHFALYGASEAGRDYNTVDMSRHRMYNEYFLPYKAAIEAGAGSVMASFNEIDGIPATGNKWLLTDVLRDDWGFNGFVVTDYTGIMEMTAHGVGDLQAVSAQALKAGIDMDMVSEGFLGTIKKSLEEGKVTEKDIDKACRRILEAKAKLGLFEDPYKYCDSERAKTQIFTDEHRAVARKIASESMVLLKNDDSLLPLKKQGTIGVIGPLADSRVNMPGTWSVAAVLDNATTLVEGMKAVVGDKARILTAKGCNLMSDAAYEERATMHGRSLGRNNRSDKDMLDEALRVARQSDVIVAALGESSELSGESSSRADLEMLDTQRTLLEALLKTGKPVVLVLFTGRPLVLNWEHENVPAILNAWFSGSEAGFAIADVLFGDVNPSGKLTMTFPKSVGQVPLFYNHKNTGRPEEGWFTKFRSSYIDIDNDPLYPFGYGLSYTQFEYSPVTLSAEETTLDKGVTASVTVTNTGKVAGKEVVQLYIRDLVGSVTRPVKELKGFDKIELAPGESRTVSFDLKEEDLAFYGQDLTFAAEPGDFHVFIGGDSTTKNMAQFTVIE